MVCEDFLKKMKVEKSEQKKIKQDKKLIKFFDRFGKGIYLLDEDI